MVKHNTKLLVDKIVKEEIKPIDTKQDARDIAEIEIKNERKLEPKIDVFHPTVKIHEETQKSSSMFKPLNISTNPIQEIKGIFNHIDATDQKKEHADMSVYKNIYGINPEPIHLEKEVYMIGEAHQYKSTKDLVSKTLQNTDTNNLVAEIIDDLNNKFSETVEYSDKTVEKPVLTRQTNQPSSSSNQSLYASAFAGDIEPKNNDKIEVLSAIKEKINKTTDDFKKQDTPKKKKHLNNKKN